MNRLSSLLPCILLLTVTLTMAENNSVEIDASDLPPIQKETSNGTSGKIILDDSRVTAIDEHVGKLEQDFLDDLSSEEKDMYLAMKEEFIRHRVKMIVIKDSIANLSPDKREDAVKLHRTEILKRLSETEQHLIEKLSVQQRKAHLRHKAEIERKRKRIKDHLRNVRNRIDERTQQ